MGGSMTIHGAGFSARSGADNNDKTTVAGKGILLAMCHLSPLSCMAISSAWGSRRSSEDWQQSADSVEKVALAAACRSGVPAVEVAASHFKLPSGVSLSVLAQV
ncbi:hypothetical protein HUS13_04255 [Pseudomonas aeruginosa]|uniref:hypothetical protein n=1 Tax=Pseudomonas aeruginosa TaxID=287 RepID=UPI0019241A97|nr:hypothetical protein [Pseudomonas aeruginosa]QQW13834.1 hypothetical protein HUS13_04255 [Pseudomonas aeruginosa]